MIEENFFDTIVRLKPEWGAKCVPGGNLINPRYIFIGQNPGKRIPNSYVCWSNPKDGSSILLLPILDELGVLQDIYFTNLVKNSTIDNVEPTNEMVDYWIPYLKQELSEYNPVKIISMGDFTYRQLLRHGIDTTKIWHPAYVMRNIKGLREQYKQQILWSIS